MQSHNFLSTGTPITCIVVNNQLPHRLVAEESRNKVLVAAPNKKGLISLEAFRLP